MLVLYSADEENFENCGLGILRDAYEAYINRKINSVYELTFYYPSKGFLNEKLQEFMIVKADGQLFRIKSINKKRTPWFITANHIFYDLNDNFLEDVAPTNQNGNGALNWLLERTVYTHKFKGFSDIEIINSARYVRKNVINAIIGEDNSLTNKWNGEIDVDNFEVKLLSRVGKDRGLQLTLNKNISGVEINIKTDNIATKLLPKGSDELLLPEIYVDSPLINNYPFPIIREIEVSDAKVSDEMSLEEAYQLMRNTCKAQFDNGIDKPNVNIKVDFVELSKTIEYQKYKNLETVYLGDTVSVFLSDYNINTKLRIISTTKNVLKNKYEKLELGEQLSNFATQQLNVNKNIDKLKSENKNLLNEAKEAATEMLKNALGGYVVKTQSEIFIMDTDDTATAERVWRWNLNGLGYSSTGINGPYETAITQDGTIVADFIKTGTMSLDRIEGLAQTISDYYKRITTLEFNIESIKSTVKLIGGNNKQRNSIGAYGTEDFEQSEEGTIIATEEELLKSKTDNGFGRVIYIGSNKWFKFKSESLVIGETYTISFKYSNILNNQCTIKLINNIETTLVDALVEKELQKVEYTFVANTEFVELYVSTGDYTMGITDYYLQTGDIANKWQPAAGEALSTVLSIYYNGIEVTSENSEIVTQISNLGFSVTNNYGKVLITFNKDKCILSDTDINGTLNQSNWLRYVQNINGNDVLLEVKI